MKRPLLIRFGLIGFVITVGIYAAQAVLPYSEIPSRTEIVVGIVSLTLCPPGLLTVPFFDIDPLSVSGAVLWLIIGLINSALYVAIGALAASFFANRRKARQQGGPPG